MMRLAVTGCNGQIARALIERAPADIAVITLARPSFDLSRPETIAGAVALARPDILINAAAYTAVDQAESEPEQAFAINAAGAGALAFAAHAIGTPIIQISTDYVFDGSGERPFREDDAIGPLGVYGRSKAEGEAAVAAANADHAILRTSWVYGPHGHNFLRTMLRLGETRDVVRVVDDQHGAPTSALDIADALIAIARRLHGSNDPALRGTFHMSASGSTNWAQFASAIFEASAARGGPSARVEPIPSAAYPTPARRPANSRLDCTKLREAYDLALPPWQDSVGEIVARCLAPNQEPNVR